MSQWNICEFLVWKLLSVTLLVLRFLENLCTLGTDSHRPEDLHNI